MWVASQTHCNIGAKADSGGPVCYGPRCTVPYSTGRNASVLQRQLPSFVFWNAKDFSTVTR